MTFDEHLRRTRIKELNLTATLRKATDGIPVYEWRDLDGNLYFYERLTRTEMVRLDLIKLNDSEKRFSDVYGAN